MKAVLCRRLGPPSVLQLEEVPRPELGADQVRVRLRAAGVNFPDVMMVAGDYQFQPPLPFVPGLEGAGEVLECAPGVSGFRPGDRVTVKLRPGAFQEEVVVSPALLNPLPAAYDFVAGAALPVAYLTAYHALVQRGRLNAGEVLLVHGAAGGVGLAAVDLGRQLGARVIAVASGEAKRRFLIDYGAEWAIDRVAENFRDEVLRLTDGQGADLVFDPVGGEAFEQSLRCLAWGGRLLVVGFASGRAGELPANYALLKGARVIGLRAGEAGRRNEALGRQLSDAVYRLAGAGRLRPHVSHCLPLAAAADGLRLIIAREAIGKVVLRMD
jgi:NADPH2:quinone reductase